MAAVLPQKTMAMQTQLRTTQPKSKSKMQTLTVTFDPDNLYVQSFLQTMRLSKMFKVEECPYDPAYVARAQKAMKGSFVKKSIKDLLGE